MSNDNTSEIYITPQNGIQGGKNKDFSVAINLIKENPDEEDLQTPFLQNRTVNQGKGNKFKFVKI